MKKFSDPKLGLERLVTFGLGACAARAPAGPREDTNGSGDRWLKSGGLLTLAADFPAVRDIIGTKSLL